MNNPESKNQGKGFKGLQSLGSQTPESAAEAPAISERKVDVPDLPSARGATARQPVQPQPSQSQTTAPPWRGWVIGLGVFGAIAGFFIWAGNQSSSSNSDASPAVANYSPSTVTETASAAPPSGPTVTMPPVGNGHVLTSGQIRYCVYEDRRIRGAEKVVNNYSQASVDAFNSMVDDYNSRCSRFSYRAGTLTPIEVEANAIQGQLEQEGQERMSAALTLAGGDAAATLADAAAASADAYADAAAASADAAADADADADADAAAAAAADAAAASADAAAAAADAAFGAD